MTLPLDVLTRRLHALNCSAVISTAGGETIVCSRRGVADLFDLLTRRPGVLEGAAVADKVVGKGAAALMILGGVAELGADVVSDAAMELLAASPVKVRCQTRVGHIMNRSRSGLCPVETLCADAPSAEACLPLISQFLNSMK